MAKQLPDARNASSNADLEESQQFLVFVLRGRTFATPLLSIREVIPTPACEPVPNAAREVVGVTNLRGEVVCVLDISAKLGTDPVSDARAVIVTDSEVGSLGAVVDDLLGVQWIPEDHIIDGPNIPAGIPKDCFLGMASLESGLIPLVNVNRLLAHSELLRSPPVSQPDSPLDHEGDVLV